MQLTIKQCVIGSTNPARCR